jgi:hypothetical protein
LGDVWVAAADYGDFIPDYGKTSKKIVRSELKSS